MSSAVRGPFAPRHLRAFHRLRESRAARNLKIVVKAELCFSLDARRGLRYPKGIMKSADRSSSIAFLRA